MRECSDCGTDKPLTEFYKQKNGVDGLQPRCKPCQKLRTQAWEKTEHGKYLRWKSSLYFEHKITPEQWYDLLARQSGVCAICGGLNIDKRNQRFHVDHDHVTGKIRGLLCQRCNHAVGLLDDDPLRMRLAAAYVERAR